MANPIQFADITGVRDKLRWANVHLGAFNDELVRLNKASSDTRFIEDGRDGEWQTMLINPVPKLSVDLSLIAGDIFTNLRDTLDHLVWQLILREGNEPHQTNSFPITTSESHFLKVIKTPPKKSEKRSPLYGLPVDGDAWTIIEEAQPWFQGKTYSYEARDDQLATLARMSNVNKHRTVLISYAVADQQTLIDMIRFSPANIQPIEMILAPTRALSHEEPTELVRFLFPAGSNVRMYMDGSFPVGIMLGDEERQTGGLQTFCARISEIVDQVAALPRVNG